MRLYNSLSRQKEEFVPIDPAGKKVGMYTCGMTVYDYAHIGHGFKYVHDDVLRRTLEYLGYEVKHVQNVTDVGHLVSDADEGEDKLEKGAKKFGKTVWEVAEYFTDYFYQTMDKLNILRPNVICKATEHIPEQIELVRKLVEKGYGYETEEAVYFDVTKFKDYGKMFGQKLEDKKVAVREEVKTGEHKKHPADFSLWFKRVGRFADHVMHWDSPWGEGFPGWHVECSAMSMKYLGEQFDIHTGGKDHLSVHHPNEIAQSEAATGKSPWVKYWIHHNFLKVEGQKMSKSLGNLVKVEDVEEKGFDVIALRYLFLTAHHSTELNFTWEALKGAQIALNKLRDRLAEMRSRVEGKEESRTKLSEEKLQKVQMWQARFRERIEDDLDMPGALAIVWEMLKDNIPGYDKVDLLLDWDQVLGLNLYQVSSIKYQVSKEVLDLVDKRETLRREKKWEEADELRKQIEDLGYTVEDTEEGAKVKRNVR